MKRFVCFYKMKEEEEASLRPPFSRVENLSVQYSAEPIWKIASRPEAHRHCSYLQMCNVHVGPHFCDFQVEQLGESEFAIACITHPEGLSVVGGSPSKGE